MTMPDQVRAIEIIERAARPFSFPATTGISAVASPDGVLTGWALHETTGAAVATVSLFDGADAGGVLLATITLASGGCSIQGTGVHGLRVRQGVTAVVTAGSVAGTVWLLL